MHLLVVESPAKARTLKGLLGMGWRVEATHGHVLDLPPRGLGVSGDDYAPMWTVLQGQQARLDRIGAAALKADRVWLATDPDREGEAIAEHVRAALPPGVPADRVAFRALTPDSVQAALQAPRAVDADLVAAQHARRVIDRLVGYEVSPFLQRAARASGHDAAGLSAGRVQSAALRILCEREEAVASARPRPYWTVTGTFSAPGCAPFTAALKSAYGEPLGAPGAPGTTPLPDRGTAEHLARSAARLDYAVVRRHESLQTLPPPPALTTAALQALAADRLGFSPKRAMRAARALFEGVEVEGALQGLVTYPRTDSTRLAPDAQAEGQAWIARRWGADLVADAPFQAPAAAHAQDAHEAIRPTRFDRPPAALRRTLTRDQLAVYTLVYERAVLSLCAPARVSSTTLDLADDGRQFMFSTTHTRTVSPGWQRVFPSEPALAPPLQDLSPVPEGASVALAAWDLGEHAAPPPQRLTPGGLVAAMEAAGIGRPSTYAATLEVLKRRGYTERKQGALRPTDLGLRVNGLLGRHFSELFAPSFTAHMERQLDEVAAGRLGYVACVRALDQDVLRPALGAARAALKGAASGTGSAPKRVEA